MSLEFSCFTFLTSSRVKSFTASILSDLQLLRLRDDVELPVALEKLAAKPFEEKKVCIYRQQNDGGERSTEGSRRTGDTSVCERGEREREREARGGEIAAQALPANVV